MTLLTILVFYIASVVLAIFTGRWYNVKLDHYPSGDVPLPVCFIPLINVILTIVFVCIVIYHSHEDKYSAFNEWFNGKK